LEAVQEAGDPRWRAYKAARSLAELAAKALAERGAPRPIKCVDLPEALKRAGILGEAEAQRMADLLKALRALHKGGENAEKALAEALALAQAITARAKRIYPSIDERLALAFKAHGVAAAYDLGGGVIAVRPEIGLEERIGLAAEVARELGRQVVIRSVDEAREDVLTKGRLIYAEDLDEEIEGLAQEYAESLCC
jgi:hypothetical protein